MAIYTPRGLKIRLSKDYAFALMARLYPRVDAFRVLQITEEVINMAAVMTYISGIVVFTMRLDPLMITVVVGGTNFAFKMAHLFGLFIPPITLILPLSRVYSWVSGYGVFLIGIPVFGFFTVGWKGVVAFIVGRIVASVFAGVINYKFTKIVFNKTGVFLTASERSFFHAYRLVADRVGVTRSLEVTDDEMDPDNWGEVFDDLMMKWPVVVSRFTEDM
ncbi:MAG: hypothetical protein JJU29_11650 [Verrucomicrobia bacterium]|nr:hypothetical protein [Verrucomicrobiota bacterium]MCH8512991.1 hypothetical protein [Kiritimatiellia bacterium]